MLKKLIKYDLKATKHIWFIYVVAIALTIFWSILFAFADFDNFWVVTISSLFSMPTVVVIVALLLLPLIFVSIRFYQHVISDEAYLTFTLPVPRYYHIISKIITYAIWYLISTFVLLLCIFIAILSSGVAFSDFLSGISFLFFQFDMLADQFSPFAAPLIIECVIIYLVYMISSPLFMIAAMSFGQVIIKRHKLLGSFVAYLILNGITEAIYGILVFVIELTAITSDTMVTIADTANFFMRILAMVGIVQVVMITALYIFSNHCLTKKLNLE